MTDSKPARFDRLLAALKTRRVAALAIALIVIGAAMVDMDGEGQCMGTFVDGFTYPSNFPFTPSPGEGHTFAQVILRAFHLLGDPLAFAGGALLILVLWARILPNALGLLVLASPCLWATGLSAFDRIAAICVGPLAAAQMTRRDFFGFPLVELWVVRVGGVIILLGLVAQIEVFLDVRRKRRALVR